MTLPYNESLSSADRKLYTERLIKLHTILGQARDGVEYKHQVWTQQTRYGLIKRLYTGHSCGTAACALGHALLHREQFPGLEAHDYTKTARRLLALGEETAAPLEPADSAFEYFGPNSLRYIFSANAYHDIGLDAEQVTRQAAMGRIEQYIREVLGCELIEA